VSSEAARCPLTPGMPIEKWANVRHFFPRCQVGQLSDLLSFFATSRGATGLSAKARADDT